MALLALPMLMGPGPARGQVWMHQDLLPLPSFRSFVRALRARGYHPCLALPANRSDLFLNDIGNGTIRHRYPELVSCSGTELNDCVFLFAKPGQATVEVETIGEQPASLAISSIRRLSQDQTEAALRDGCDAGPSPDSPCPR